ncbi:hypothetical protein ITP53_40690 [Nonomuraea sp. K274]|uniref:Uncharacterized protein n=1 Tax=Nonomuraea cypriaca TaxID=1187855 RepID=A0A931AK64_9ACTN|nr:hypothetical protein [Nonomuraea cypriaca]MBF8191894.1 hypothetical protein [Nonomuraea cypriaca]
MKHRAMVILLIVGVATAGFIWAGFVRAAEAPPDLGGPIVVTPSPGHGTHSTPGSSSPGSDPTPGSGEPTPVRSGEPTPARSGEPTPATSTTTAKTLEPTGTARPAPRKTKAEPVKPPSPRPGGDDDDDDDDGGDDDED